MAVREERLLIGTMDSYLLYRLTNKKTFATDSTNASRTLLYNIHTNSWDEELLNVFNVKQEWLPEIKSSNAFYGRLDINIIKLDISIFGVIGDSQGALFGQLCTEKGKTKISYGTGSSILIYSGINSKVSSKDLLTTVAWSLDDNVHYALEGIIKSSGDTLKWVKDNLGLYSQESEIDEITNKIKSTEGVYIIPGFVGLGASYWKPKAKASIVGITRKTTKEHIILAA